MICPGWEANDNTLVQQEESWVLLLLLGWRGCVPVGACLWVRARGCVLVNS